MVAYSTLGFGILQVTDIQTDEMTFTNKHVDGTRWWQLPQAKGPMSYLNHAQCHSCAHAVLKTEEFTYPTSHNNTKTSVYSMHFTCCVYSM